MESIQQKVVSLYDEYGDNLWSMNFIKLARSINIDRRILSQINTLRYILPDDEFEYLLNYMRANTRVCTSNGERTSSLEQLCKIVKAGGSILESSNTQVSVYVLEANGICKVGVAKSITTRVASMQTGNPYKIEVVAEFRFNDERTARDIEAEVHRMLTHYRMQGEWFNTGKEEIVELLLEVIGDLPVIDKRIQQI